MSKPSKKASTLVWAGVVLLIILHQDFWFWDTHKPLLFGFVPVALWYHALISLGAGIIWALANKYCWPEGVDDIEPVDQIKD
ncbi:DUF3311 domain-containing protein [Verrucomicrobia bacterium]|nr:DUF3311 domain-containing protein [Verrucomicrobiota bacterium]